MLAVVVYLYRNYTITRSAQSFQFNKKQVRDYHTSTTSALEYFEHNFDRSFFTGAKSILDIGCGDGKVTAFIAKLYPQCTVVGSDVSQEMIAFAMQHYPPSQYPNLSFIKKDARDLGFVDHFDRVISFNCLHWINDQKLALKSIYGSLKSGGKAFIIVTPKDSQDPLPISCGAVIKTIKWLPSFITFNSPHSMHIQDEYRQMLLNVGFLIDKIGQRELFIKYNNRAEAEVFIRSILTPLYHLPEHKRADFLNDLFGELAKQGVVSSNGSIVLRVSQLDLVITKP